MKRNQIGENDEKWNENDGEENGINEMKAAKWKKVIEYKCMKKMKWNDWIENVVAKKAKERNGENQ
jgi:hypothetical protein